MYFLRSGLYFVLACCDCNELVFDGICSVCVLVLVFSCCAIFFSRTSISYVFIRDLSFCCDIRKRANDTLKRCCPFLFQRLLSACTCGLQLACTNICEYKHVLYAASVCIIPNFQYSIYILQLFLPSVSCSQFEQCFYSISCFLQYSHCSKNLVANSST